MKRLWLWALLAATAQLSGCERRMRDGAGNERTAEAGAMSESQEFRRCVSSRIDKPWSVTEAYRAGDEFSIRLEAEAADLAIRHRPGPARQQRFVSVSIGPFAHYTVFNPALLESSLANQAIRPAQEVRGVPVASLAPLSVYSFSDSTILLTNPQAGEFCVDHAIPADWPNPFARCELVSGGNSAVFTFSSEAIASLPSLFQRVRALIDEIVPCLNHVKDHQNG